MSRHDTGEPAGPQAIPEHPPEAVPACDYCSIVPRLNADVVKPEQTTGDWSDEPQSMGWLRAFLQGAQLFRVFEEVEGVYCGSALHRQSRGVRADLLLLPAPRLADAGWTGPDGGALVVEVKRSGVSIAGAVSQLRDYMHSRFWVGGGVAVQPSWGFVFPAALQKGAFSGTLINERMGTAYPEIGKRWHPCDIVTFFCGDKRVLHVERDGGFRIGDRNFGKKCGSR